MTQIEPHLLDGIETFNLHPGHNSKVAIAAGYAKKHDLIPIVGTDYHHFGHEGLGALLTKTEMKTTSDIVTVLKNRDYLFEISGSILIP